MNLSTLIQLDQHAKPAVCPECGLEIRAGGAGSGCDPAVAEANGTKCGRPPGAKNKPLADKPKWEKPVRDENGKPVFIQGVINGKRVSLVKLPDPGNPGKLRWFLQDENGLNVHDFFSLNHAKWNIGKNPDKFIKPGPEILEQRKAAVNVEPEQMNLPGINPRVPKQSTLATGRIVDKKYNSRAGVNDSYRVTLEDGTQANFKPAAGEAKWLVQQVGGPLYIREALAYDWAQIVGLKEMPEVAIREIDGKIGSIHRWADGVPAVESTAWSQVQDVLDDRPWNIAKRLAPLWENFDKDSARDVAAYDFISTNTDRHYKNFLINDKSGKAVIVPIDHGASFHGQGTHSEVFKLVKNSEQMIPQHTKDKWRNKWPQLESAAKERKIPPAILERLKRRYEQFMNTQTWDGL